MAELGNSVAVDADVCMATGYCERIAPLLFDCTDSFAPPVRMQAKPELTAGVK